MGLTDSYAYFLPVHALYQIVSIKLCHDKHTSHRQMHYMNCQTKRNTLRNFVRTNLEEFENAKLF